MGEVCVSLAPLTVSEGLTQAARAVRSGAGMVEFRLDRFVPGEEVERLFAASRVPAIAACRFSRDGGKFKGGLEERMLLLARAARGGATFVDLEHWEEGSVPAGGRSPDHPPLRVIRSLHDLKGTPSDLMAVQAQLLARGADVLKIATTAFDLADAAPLVALWRQEPQRVPTVAFAMGRAGLATRLLCLRFGAPFTYAAPEAGEELAPGQLPLADVVGRYRAADVGETTRVFGVLGSSLTHSLSPLLHNRALRALGLDAVYLPLETDRPEEVVAMLRPDEWGGLSVTAPHKERLARVVDGRDLETSETGALNTLVFRGGRAIGHNTDVPAIQAALRLGMAMRPAELGQTLRGVRACVLGTGGAARAAVTALRHEGAEVLIAGRSRDRIKDYARELGIEVGRLAWETLAQWRPAAVVHCTPVGTVPGVQDSLLPDWRVEPHTVVLDLVYNPADTALLQRARRAGAYALSGLLVFVLQAALQLRLWTGKSVRPEDLVDFLGPLGRTLLGQDLSRLLAAGAPQP